MTSGGSRVGEVHSSLLWLICQWLLIPSTMDWFGGVGSWEHNIMLAVLFYPGLDPVSIKGKGKFYPITSLGYLRTQLSPTLSHLHKAAERNHSMAWGETSSAG